MDDDRFGVGQRHHALRQVQVADVDGAVHLQLADVDADRLRDAHRQALHLDGVQRLVHATAYPLFGTTAEMHGVVSVFWQVDHEETGA